MAGRGSNNVDIVVDAGSADVAIATAADVDTHTHNMYCHFKAEDTEYAFSPFTLTEMPGRRLGRYH